MHNSEIRTALLLLGYQEEQTNLYDWRMIKDQSVVIYSESGNTGYKYYYLNDKGAGGWLTKSQLLSIIGLEDTKPNEIIRKELKVLIGVFGFNKVKTHNKDLPYDLYVNKAGRQIYFRDSGMYYITRAKFSSASVRTAKEIMRELEEPDE